MVLKRKSDKFSFEDIFKAREAIINTGLSGGKIDCPVCKAEESLLFSIAECNGHVHAKCKTDGCVQWME